MIKGYKNNDIIINNYMTELTDILVDTIIIGTIWGLLNNDAQKYVFGIGMSIYLITKYI